VLAGWILSLLVAAVPAAATTASGAVHEGEPRVRATLLADVTQVEPGGTCCFGVRLQTARGWHVSWRNPGEVGLPTEVRWDVPRVLAPDWTHRDARITRALAAHGRAVIPMSLVCSPVSPDRPEALPELLASAGWSPRSSAPRPPHPARSGSRRHAEATPGTGSPLHGLSTKVRAGRRARPDSG